MTNIDLPLLVVIAIIQQLRRIKLRLILIVELK